MTERDFKRGSSAMKSLNRDQIKRLMETLEALGWVEATALLRPNSAPHWRVKSRVHVVFPEKVREETERRAEIRNLIAGLYEGGV